MKIEIKKIFLAAAVSILFLGCESTKIQQKETPDFYTITDVCEDGEFWNSEINYPVFKGELYKLLNDSVNDCVTIFNSEVKQWTEGLTAEDAENPCHMPYSFDMKFTVYEGKNTVSYCATFWEYTGGAHGNYGFFSDTINKTTGERLNITEITGLSEEAISTICKEQLGEKLEYEDAVAPSEVKKFHFYVENNTLTILFAPYEVACYASGVLEVRIKLRRI